MKTRMALNFYTFWIKLIFHYLCPIILHQNVANGYRLAGLGLGAFCRHAFFECLLSGQSVQSVQNSSAKPG